jgi:hypothetical protein
MESKVEYIVMEPHRNYWRCECETILGERVIRGCWEALHILDEVYIYDGEIICNNCGRINRWRLSDRHLLPIIKRHKRRLAKHMRELDEIKTKEPG